MIRVDIITAKLGESTDDDFSEITFESIEEYKEAMRLFINSIEQRTEYNDCVWVIGTDHNYQDEEHQEVFVTSKTDNLHMIVLFDLLDAEGYHKEKGDVSVYIHRYDSFEYAYRTALDMREGRKNCYEDGE